MKKAPKLVNNNTITIKTKTYLDVLKLSEGSGWSCSFIADLIIQEGIKNGWVFRKLSELDGTNKDMMIANVSNEDLIEAFKKEPTP